MDPDQREHLEKRLDLILDHLTICAIELTYWIETTTRGVRENAQELEISIHLRNLEEKVEKLMYCLGVLPSEQPDDEAEHEIEDTH